MPKSNELPEGYEHKHSKEAGMSFISRKSAKTRAIEKVKKLGKKLFKKK